MNEITGPFEHEQEARDHQAVRAVRYAHSAPLAALRNHRILEDACTQAGVELGAYDHRILIWLAQYEPATCAVIAGLIRRAHSAGAGAR